MAVSASLVNSVVNTYTYNYQGKLQPKLDKNDDAAWSRDELKNYADAYKKATGNALDVDALMKKYANEDGVIDYKSQEQMKADDALGLSALLKASNSANTASSTGTTSTSTAASTTATMSQSRRTAVYDAVRSFTYEYSGKLQPLLDKNSDGVWNKEELQNYADAYKKATGNALDVDKLLEKYGNEDGIIDPTAQAQMKKDDALGMTALKTAFDQAKVAEKEDLAKAGFKPTKDTTIRGRTSEVSLDDLLGSMSPSGKAYFSMTISRLNNQSSLLSSFGFGTTSSSSLDMMGLLQNSNTLQMYKAGGSSLASAMTSQLMNFTI